MDTFFQYFFGITLFLTSTFLILLVLVQRGRGGGLAGALGGPGGQSAFGAKAGDTFTWVTFGTALVWILLAMATIKMIGSGSGGFGNIQTNAPSTTSVEAPLGDASRSEKPATGAGAKKGSSSKTSSSPAASTSTSSSGAGSTPVAPAKTSKSKAERE